MATIGKFCLALTVLGTAAVSLYLLPAVGKLQNDVAEKLQKSQADLEATRDRHRKASEELLRSSSRLAQLQAGRDKSWNIQQSGDTGVSVDGDRLAVTGLGTLQNLVMLTDEEGQSAGPAVHAFKQLSEGGMYYVGEFIAEQIDSNSCVLIPTWQFTEDEVNFWDDPSASWRFRTLIPPDVRLRIDGLNASLQSLRVNYDRIDANVVRQEKALNAAEQQLEQRGVELVGRQGAKAVVNPDLPEFEIGLTDATRDLEDRRNDLMLEIDRLRRLVKVEAERREELLRQLNELVDDLPQDESPGVARTSSDIR